MTLPKGASKTILKQMTLESNVHTYIKEKSIPLLTATVSKPCFKGSLLSVVLFFFFFFFFGGVFDKLPIFMMSFYNIQT